MRVLELLGRLAAVVRQADAEAALAEQVPEVGAEVAVVVDDQDQRLVERLVDRARAACGSRPAWRTTFQAPAESASSAVAGLA